MKTYGLLLVVFGIISGHAQMIKSTIDASKHKGLLVLKTEQPYTIRYSEGHFQEAQTQATLIEEAYTYLSAIMGPKTDFCVLAVSAEDWKTNAYGPVPGLPEYYRGNLIVGVGQNSMADNYAMMLKGFPKEMTTAIYEIYADRDSTLHMKLFFDKLSVHELTHNFQDPNNGSDFSMSRWLEELHANMGLYAFYKEKRPQELKYITTLVDFSLQYPPPNLQYTSLEDFDAHYYEMDSANYGQYQMRITKAAQKAVDSLGVDILKPLNDFIIKYDASQKTNISPEVFKEKLGEEVHPYFVEIIDSW